MDLRKDESLVAVARLKTFPIEEKPKPVLVTSEKNNAVPANVKTRTSHKFGVTSALRSPSPNARQTSTPSGTSAPQRAQSAERRRPTTSSSPSSRRSAPSSPRSQDSQPSTPLSKSSRPSSPSLRPSVTSSSTSSRPTTPVCDSMVERLNSSRRSLVGRAPDGLWPSIRSLSISFQSESSTGLGSKSDRQIRNPPPDRKLKSSPSIALEVKRTPLRGRNSADQSENSRSLENSYARTIDQLRWPGRVGGKGSFSALSTESVDLTEKIRKTASPSISVRGFSSSRGISSTDAVRRDLKSSTNEITQRLSSTVSEKAARTVSSPRTGTSLMLELPPSSTKLSRSTPPVPSLIRPSSPNKAAARLVSSNIISKKAPPLVSSARTVTSPTLEMPPSSTRPSRNQSPVPTLVCPSPNKAAATLSSISRGMPSPSRTRPSTPSSPTRTRPSTPLSPVRTRPSSPCSSSTNTATQIGASSCRLNYITDVQKGKRSPIYTKDSHLLRLLCNRDLQWHFVNARADAAFLTQKLIAEDMLYNVWNLTSELRDSANMKRIDVQNQRQEMTLNLILREQIAYLESWSALEVGHSISLSGTIESLQASTLRLPVTGGARADVGAVKNAISSAVDVMQAMGSSICHLLSGVEGANSLVSELSQITATQNIMLDDCRELLASTAAMQVQECSLRTHLIQLRQDVQVD